MTDSMLLPEETEEITETQPTSSETEDLSIVGAEDTIMEIPVYPEPETEPITEKLMKKHRFLKGLSVYFAVWIVLIALGLWFFHAYLGRYEAATPNSALDHYVEWIQTENYEAIYAASDFEETILNTKDEFIKYLSRLFNGDTSTLEIREKITSTDERKEYSIYMDGTRVCSLSLIHNPEWGETAWSYVTEVQYQPPTLIYADETVRLEINGTDVSLLGLVAEPAAETVLGGVDDDAEMPNICVYTLKDLLNPPEISALTLSGDTCSVSSPVDNTYHVYAPVGDALREEREELAKNAAFKYAAFVGKDASRNDVLKFVHRDSDLYDTIRNFSNGWFTTHDSYEFKEVTVSNYAQFTSSDFSCDVSFLPVYVRNNKKLESVPFHCRLSFVLKDDEWKMVSLVQVVEEIPETENSDATTVTP